MQIGRTFPSAARVVPNQIEWRAKNWIWQVPPFRILILYTPDRKIRITNRGLPDRCGCLCCSAEAMEIRMFVAPHPSISGIYMKMVQEVRFY